MRKLGIAIALAAALSVTACGSAPKHYDTVPARAVIAAATTTQKVPSERIHQDIKLTVQGKSGHSTADGLFDNLRHRGTFQLDLSGVLELTGAPPYEGKDGELRILSPTLFYIHAPVLQNQIGAEWLKVDLQALGQSQGIDFGSLTPSGGAGDPTQVLDQLRAAAGPVQERGGDKVRGVSTTHYRATIDLRRTPALVAPSKRAAAQRSVDAILRLGASPRVQTDIWVAPSDKLVHRVEQKYSYEVDGHEIAVDQKVELYDFGVRVPPVQAPPKAQVQDLAGPTP